MLSNRANGKVDDLQRLLDSEHTETCYRRLSKSRMRANVIMIVLAKESTYAN